MRFTQTGQAVNPSPRVRRWPRGELMNGTRLPLWVDRYYSERVYLLMRRTFNGRNMQNALLATWPALGYESDYAVCPFKGEVT